MTDNTKELTNDLRYLIYVSLQYEWRGETDLPVDCMQRLEAHGWVAESEENNEFDITDEGKSVIDALLRERESAKAAVTDEIFAAFDAAQTKAMGEYEMQQYHAGKESHLVSALDYATRKALEAVAPMLAGARVPERKPLPNLLLAQYHEAVGWNACRDAMLAAAPKPKKE